MTSGQQRNRFKYLFVLAGIGLFFVFAYQFLRSAFDWSSPHVSREDALENFEKNEQHFAELDSFFTSHLPDSSKALQVSVSRTRWSRYSLSVLPLNEPANGKPRFRGGNELELDSPQLDSALVMLSWTPDILRKINDLLFEVECKSITSNIDHGHVSLYYKESGLNVINYTIFNRPLTDSMIQRFGKPIKESGVGSRTLIGSGGAL